MLDEAPSGIDLLLIFLLSVFFWTLELMSGDRKEGDSGLDVKEALKDGRDGGKKFLWRLNEKQGNAKLEIWREIDSTLSSP